MDDGTTVSQLNTDLLVNKLPAEDYKAIVDTVQSGGQLTAAQSAALVQANVLTPVKEVDLSLPDINIPTKAIVEPEPVVNNTATPAQNVAEASAVVAAGTTPVPVATMTKIKKFGLFDTITSYIYSFLFAKK